MPVDFEVSAFLENCRATKPPYSCPVEECRKVYKTFDGIRGHMERAHSPEQMSVSPGVENMQNSTSFSPDRTVVATAASTSGEQPLLTYEDTQRYVTFELDGRSLRWPIEEPLQIVCAQQEATSVTTPELMSIASPGETGEAAESMSSTAAAVASKASALTIDTSDCGGSKLGKPGKTPAKPSKAAAKPGSRHSSNKQPPHQQKAPRASSVLPGQPVSPPPGRIPSPKYEVVDTAYQLKPRPRTPECYIRYIEKSAEELDELVEYDLDEEDDRWLAAVNNLRRERQGLKHPVLEDNMELLMDRFEKEAHFRSTGDHRMEDDDAVCSVCLDGECYNTNAILFCDMCNLAVHQECYGIPYVPEASWLCRRCLQCPSESPQCILCPNRGGAFKMTTDNRWCHVVCALWIPEVIFSNTVFLEPVDNIEKIPAARWKLACYICKQRNVGACIQCHKANCYTAFHVTCALQAGLYMRIEGVRDGSTADGIRKTALCDAHSPSEPKQGNASAMYAATEDEDEDKTTPSPEKMKRQKMRRARKILAERRNASPGVSVPVIAKDRLAAIGALLPASLADRDGFLRRLYNYWRLKRQARSGVPLLKRLQACRARDFVANDRELQQLCKQLKFWQRLRQDLERARLLAELVRKREKLKRELVRTRARIAEVTLAPRLCLLKQLHSSLSELDTQKIFAEPVELAAYREVIKRPMDFATMLSRVESNNYASVAELKSDFDLMLANCHAFNRKDSVYCRAANKLATRSAALFSAAFAAEAASDYEPETSLHRWQLPQEEPKVDTNNSNIGGCGGSATRPLTRRSVSQESNASTASLGAATTPQHRRSLSRLSSSGQQAMGLVSGGTAAEASTLVTPVSSAAQQPHHPTPAALFAGEEESGHSDPEGCETGDTAVFTEFVGNPSRNRNPSRSTSSGDGPVKPLDLVWAKCRGYPSYPGLVIDPDMPKSGYSQNGVPIPVPPDSVLQSSRGEDYLILFFDQKRTWQWLMADKLELLGVCTEVDRERLADSKRSRLHSSVRKAYKLAIEHLCKVTGKPYPYPDAAVAAPTGGRMADHVQDVADIDETEAAASASAAATTEAAAASVNSAVGESGGEEAPAET